MRYEEFKNPHMQAYQVIVVLSDNASAPTVIYSDSPENAWLIASTQYGSKNILSVNSPNTPFSQKPVDRPSAIRFWADRFRKYAGLATPKSPPREFADQVDDYLKRQDKRELARVKAKKAKWQLNNLT